MGYSSQYYDPAKAHEYYEKHKQLIGKKRKFNDKGKLAAKVVREAINEEKKQAIKQISEDCKAQVKKIREELKNKLKGLSKEEKARVRERYAEKIGALREKVKGIKEQTREAYKSKLEGELDKIASDSSMVKSSKRKKK